MIRVRRATPGEVIDLRHAVLRAGLPRETAIFPGDDAPGTVHVVAEDPGETVVGCATMLPSAWNGRHAWQVRGMAVTPRLQRSGVGGLLLKALQRLAQADVAGPADASPGNGVRLMWCNARKPAVGFYERHGWVVASDEFEIPSAGPHVKMTLKLPPPDVR